ncbi:MAG: membrane protein insertase YidC [Bacteroidaceae bacterium]|nr:membrane protein insertase YidC [Bacteroidaceae bacterium]
MDRKSYIGLLLIGAAMVFFVLWSGKSQKKTAPQQAQYEQKLDSARTAAQEKTEMALDSAMVQAVESASDSLSPLFPALHGSEQTVTLDNGLVQIDITSKGATPSKVVLPGYKNQQGGPVCLFDKDEINMNFKFDGKNMNILSRDLYFQPVGVTSTSVTMRLETNGYGHMDFIYSLLPESYMLNLDIKAVGMDNFFSTGTETLAVDWIQNLRQQEKGFDFEQRYTELTYKRNDKSKAKLLGTPMLKRKSTAMLSAARKLTVEEPLDWVAFKNQFFSCIMMSNSCFEADAKLAGQSYKEGKGYLKKLMLQARNQFDPRGAEASCFQFYFGPNDYAVLKDNSKLSRGEGKARLNAVINLGWPVVREVNRFLLIPLFNLLSHWNLNMGLVILLMTIIVKLLVMPAQVKSYMSSAKMRALKPYADQIAAQYPKEEDAMKKQQETMAMYSKYGVSPMGGCLPALVQMPVWMAFYFLVPNAIELRQQSFLWATDLTGFDDLIHWNTHIPWIGTHLSIFCVLFCVTNIINTAISMKQQQVTPGQEETQNMMKWMMYLMPVFFFFGFNNYSSGLCYYYFISGLVSIITMIWLRRSTDEKKILAKLEADYAASRNDPSKAKKASGMMARLEAMQKEQERLQQQQQRRNN